MSCKTETKTINEHEYSATQWPAEKAMIIKFKLIKAFGASLSIIADTDNSDGISNGLNALFNSNSPEEIVALMKSCVVGVARDGKVITETSFDEFFSGDDLMDVYKVFVFVVGVNYANFLKGQWQEKLLAVQDSL